MLAQRGGTACHSFRWLAAQPDTKLRIFGLYDDGLLLGGAPICVKEKMGIRLLPQPRLTPYFGPVLADELLHSGRADLAVRLLLREVYEPFDAFCFSPPPQANELRHALEPHFGHDAHHPVKKMRTNWKAPIPPADLIASYPQSSRRNNIRRALRKGTRAQRSSDYETIHRLSALSYEANGRPHPVAAESFTRMAKATEEAGLGAGMLAFNAGGTPIASAWMLFDRHLTHNVMTGVDPDYRSANGGSVALHQALSMAMERHTTFDFNGSMAEGINTYFKSFGPVETSYTHYRAVHSRKMKLLKASGLVAF
ncbi:MAG: GNAT family N-acetyltransferase [Cyclonatronaceae bacterium]